jgi:predicted PurR-regulated permease PerM
VLVVLLGLVISFGLLAGPGLAEQATNLRDLLTSQAHSIQDRFAGTSWGRLVLQYVPESLGGQREGGLPGLPSGFAGSIAGLLGSVFGLFGTLAVVVITAIYLAATPQTYVDGLLRLVKEEHRPKTRALCGAAGQALWHWSLGQAIDMLVVGLLSGLGLWFIGVPMPLALGVVAGLTNFVPYIGAIAGAVPAVIIAFSAGPTQGYETIALFLAVQGFEGNVLAPLIQNRTVELPPGLTILSQTVFGAVLGLAGLIFATPLCAAIVAVADKAMPPLRPEDRA